MAVAEVVLERENLGCGGGGVIREISLAVVVVVLEREPWLWLMVEVVLSERQNLGCG